MRLIVFQWPDVPSRWSFVGYETRDIESGTQEKKIAEGARVDVMSSMLVDNSQLLERERDGPIGH